MAMKAFQVEGDFQMGRVRQPFALQTVAADEAGARSRIMATLGSRHGVNRRQVSITTVKPLAKDQVTDATALHELKA
ncbi:MAG: 50S ribosomal protein L18Ae [Thermoplasmatota archaeon]